MSLASPQNRDELKSYIKTRLGAPVLQINVSDEQMDLAINDAFQYFNERQHYDATERVFLSTRIEQEFKDYWSMGSEEVVDQGSNQTVNNEGIVTTLQLANPGSGYPMNTEGNGMDSIGTKGGSGQGLSVNADAARTTSQGLVSVTVKFGGKGYQVGDQITILGGNRDAVFEVTAIATEAKLNEKKTFITQNNYVVLPDSVVGVPRILRPRNFAGIPGIPGAGMISPFLMGGMGGAQQCGGMYFDLTSYFTMQQFLATMEWVLYPVTSYSFNRRTHRLHIDSDNFNARVGVGDYLVMECDVTPDPDMFPDVWNDMFLKELSTAYVQLAWGRVLTKYQNVQLPGGITMNGDQIKQEAQETIQNIKERFAMDYADPVLDVVG